MSISCNSPCSHRKSTDGILCAECEALEERTWDAAQKPLLTLVAELADALEQEKDNRGTPVHASVDIAINALLARARAALGDK